MPVQYTGNESNVSATRDDVSATLPVDGDPRNASSINTPLQRLLDFMQRVRKRAGFLDLASTWTARQAFSRGIDVSRQAGDASPSLVVAGPAAFDAVTSSGSVTGGAFNYGTEQSMRSYLAAIEFQAMRDSPGLGGVPGLPTCLEVRVGDTGGTSWNARLRIPIGAAITGVDVLSLNTYSPGNDLSLDVVISRFVVASNGNVTRTYLNAGGGGGNALTVTATGLATQPRWYAVPLIAAPGAQPMEGFIELTVVHPPQASGSVALKTFAARVTYNLTTLAPS